jgi:hypothetical protein
MIPSDRFIDYGHDDNTRMAKKAEEFLEIFNEVSKKISTRKLVKLKVLPGEEDNSIWIDPSIMREFMELKDTKMPVQKIVDVYDRWFEQLYKLTIINEQRLHKKKVSFHLTEMMIICASFQEILKVAIEGMPVPPNGPTRTS